MALLRFRLAAVRLRWLPFPGEAAARRRIAADIRRALGKDATDRTERRRLASAALLYRRMGILLPLSPDRIEGRREPLAAAALLLAPAGWFDGELRRWAGPDIELRTAPPPCLPGANPGTTIDSLPRGTRLIRYVRMGVSRGRVEWGPELPEEPDERREAAGRWLDGVFADNPAHFRWLDGPAGTERKWQS